MGTGPETAVEATTKASAGRWTIGHLTSILVLILLIAVPLAVKNFIIFQLTILLIYAIAVLALNILTGGSGQFSLGQSAFYAVGAYTTAILMEHANVHYVLALPVAGVVCFGFGFLFGRPALRLSGIYLALATFALATAMPQLLKLGVVERWTGGVQGLTLTKPDAPFGLPMSQDMWLYYFTLAISLAIYLLSANLLNSRSGRAFMAIRDNEIAAAAMGVNVSLYKTLAFGISAGITGVAGGLGAIAVQFVAPDSYTIALAISLFLGMVVGGVGWLPGSLVGVGVHHLRAQHRRPHFEGPFGRPFRRVPVSHHLPDAAWGAAAGDRRRAAGRQASEELKRRPAFCRRLRVLPRFSRIAAAAGLRLNAVAGKRVAAGVAVDGHPAKVLNASRSVHPTRLKLFHSGRNTCPPSNCDWE